MKYVVYARVSERGSDFDGETTIKMQINYCREYVKFHGGEIIAEYADEFCSGKDTNRPQFSKLLQELESGDADWDCLIVYKLSRMTRSLKDGANIFAELFRQGKGFVSATENMDFSSPSGRAMLGMMQVFNQFEREQTAENTRNKMMSIARAGLWPSGNPPYGYMRGEKKDNNLYIDPRKAEIVRDIFEMYAGDRYSTRDILHKYRDEVYQTQIFTMLRNETYLGFIIYADHKFPGKHEPLISEELFERVQRKLPQKKYQSRPKAQTYPFLLTGLLYCHCGQRMTPASAKSGDYQYYVCRDKFNCKKRMSAPKLERNVIRDAKSISITDEMIEETVKNIEAERKAFLKDTEPELKNLKKAIDKGEREKKKILDMLMKASEKGKIPEDIKKTADERLEKLGEELENLNIRLSILEKERNSDTDIYTQAAEDAKSLKTFADSIAKAEKADPDALRMVLMKHIAKITLTGDGKYIITPVFDSSSNITKWRPGRESNPRPTA